MKSLPELVHRWPSILLGSLLPIAAAIWLFQHSDKPWEFWVGQDEMEYADISRRIARGEGFTTGLIYPIELAYGADRDHPNLIRAPLWPLLLGGVFSVSGPSEAAAHGLLLAIFCLTVLACGALGATLGGPVVGFVAGLAVATFPATRTLAFLAITEPLFTLLIVLTFLLMARRAAPAVVGVACGLVYLTRANGLALLPPVLIWCVYRNDRWRALASCLVGFAAIALPWWIRNALVAGDPFFTFYRQLAYHDCVPVRRVRPSYTFSVMHYLDPTLSPTRLASPLEKLRSTVPLLIERPPLLGANLAACVGVVIGCIRRDRLSLVFVLLVVLSTFAIALVIPRGRYFAPLFPLLIVLGSAGWTRLGKWPGALGILLILAAPFLPSPFPPKGDLEFIRAVTRLPRAPSAPAPWQDCIASGDLVVGERASDITWRTDATTIWLPATEGDFWEVIERFPVEFVYIEKRKRLLTPRFEESFAPRSDCGRHLYQRRDS